MANRRCEQCGSAMPHRMSRQRGEDGRLVCDNCKRWPQKIGSMTETQQREFAKRAAEAVTSIMRVAHDADWGVRETAGGVTYSLDTNGYSASVWGNQNPGTYEWEVLGPNNEYLAGTSDPVGLDLALDSAEAAIPGFQRAASRKVAHDSGDNAILNHCPFCGSGAITGGSDGSVECDYCHTVFTVQVQPKHPNMPQTIDGQPMPPPGMPAGQQTEMSGPTDPAVDSDQQGNPTDPLGDAHADPTEQVGGHDPNADQDPAAAGSDGGDSSQPPWLQKKKKPAADEDPTKKKPNPFAKGSALAHGPLCTDCFHATYGYDPEMGDGESSYAPGICSRCGSDEIVFTIDPEFSDHMLTPPEFRKGAMFFTAEGEVLPFDSYISRLALDYADDRLAVLTSVRSANDVP